MTAPTSKINETLSGEESVTDVCVLKGPGEEKLKLNGKGCLKGHDCSSFWKLQTPEHPGALNISGIRAYISKGKFHFLQLRILGKSFMN